MKLGVRDITNLYDIAYGFFEKKLTIGAENERYRAVKNFDDAQLKEIESQGRQAYSIALMNSKLNNYLTYQRRNRTEWKLTASEDPQDEIKAEVGNIQFRDLENRCDMVYAESDIFDSGAGIMFGASEIYVDFDKELRPVISLRELDYRNVMWDTNSTRYDKSDALWMCKFDKISRLQLKKEYGLEKVKDLSPDNLRYGRNQTDFYQIKNRSGDDDADVFTKFTHYQKVLREYKWVLFNDYMKLHNLNGVVALKTRSKKEAERKLRELRLPYKMNGYPLGQNEIVVKRELGIDKYVLVYSEILEYEETEMPDSPIDIYHSFYFKGEFWTLTDVLKPIQQFIDRYIAQIDFSFGADIKQAYEVAVNNLADGFTLEKAIEILQTGGYIPVTVPNSVRALRGQGVNPQWMQMLGIMLGYMDDISGGRSFSGLMDSSKESGIAIKEKKQQGESTVVLPLDNLSRWKRTVGRKLLWWFNKYDTQERIIKIAGASLKPQMMKTLESMGIFTPSNVSAGVGYLKINTPATHLRDAEFELKVVESGLSESSREKKLAKLAAVGQLIPNLSVVPAYHMKLLEAADLDYEDRVEISQGYSEFLQAQAEAQAREQEMKEKSQSIEDAVKIADSVTKAKALKKKND